jgi:DNA-binding MarR family transcriptional regulator
MSDLPLDTHLAQAQQISLMCMGMQVRRASRVVTQIYDAAFRPVDLVLSQFTLLVAIHLIGSATTNDLAQTLLTDQTTLTRNLKLLENRGLIVKQTGRDRRTKLISLTSKGQSILSTAIPLWEQAQADIVQRFGIQKFQQLLELLSDFSEII